METFPAFPYLSYRSCAKIAKEFCRFSHFCMLLQNRLLKFGHFCSLSSVCFPTAGKNESYPASPCRAEAMSQAGPQALSTAPQRGPCRERDRPAETLRLRTAPCRLPSLLPALFAAGARLNGVRLFRQKEAPTLPYRRRRRAPSLSVLFRASPFAGRLAAMAAATPATIRSLMISLILSSSPPS